MSRHLRDSGDSGARGRGRLKKDAGVPLAVLLRCAPPVLFSVDGDELLTFLN